MTKIEYLTRECHASCGEGICDVNCPHLRDVAKAWDACSEHWQDKIKAAFYNGLIDPFAAKLLLGDVPHPVDDGRAKAKEKR